MKIPVWHPSLTEEEFAAVRRVLEIGYLGMGSNVFEFERASAAALDADEKTVVSAHTGQSALHLALLALGVTDGDIVITPAFNNVADFQAILACGATPYFCDVDPVTGLMSLDSLRRCPVAKAKCVITLDYASQYCDLATISEICRMSGASLIYDAAHTFGSDLAGRLGLADATMFSFDPIKTLTAIDAGIIHSNSEEVIDSIRKARHMGMEQNLEALKQNKRSWNYDVRRPGYRYHLSNVHAAMGTVQIKRLPEIGEKRKALAARFRELTGEGGDALQYLRLDEGFIPFMNVARVETGKRDALREHLETKEIQTGVHWTPGHHFTLFKDCPADDLSGTEKFYETVLSLPFYTDMTDDECAFAADAVKGFFKKSG